MDNKDYLFVLSALKEIPFSVGKNLLIDFLSGEAGNSSINNNSLDRLESFGTLSYSYDELSIMIDNLVKNGLIKYKPLQKNKYWKVLELTRQGEDEIENPSLFKKKIAYNFKPNRTSITEKEKKLFEAFNFFLEKYNDEQKKAIISTSEKILCIAGAGSGKTSVLTKRIEFLTRYRSIPAGKILAITFTRKARSEMLTRLQKEGINDVRVETFNSFCEKTLKLQGKKIYEKEVRVMTYKDKIIAVKKALAEQNTGMERAINTYFSESQRKSKTNEQLANIFMHDCFMILDYIKSKGEEIKDFSGEAEQEHRESAKLVSHTIIYLDAYMKENGLRDYMDQLLDTIRFFKENNELIPEFEHILVDEYQDVNSIQVELIDLLNPKNLFCVGDPRQSIFGWRGSDIKYILDFEKKYSNAEIITLTKNYRSTKHVVELMNKSIKKLGLPDIISVNEGDRNIKLLNFSSENEEFEFVAEKILGSKIPRNEIFVLARTNKQLNELSVFFSGKEIKHVVKSDELYRPVEAQHDDVTLATVHAIKGLEAEMVFVIGCTMQNFPCKSSDHPVTEIVKVHEYDKEEEEKRLFYVAISRSKNILYMTYSGRSHTYFITDEMKSILKAKVSTNKSRDLFEMLKMWRTKKAKEYGIAPYLVMHDSTLLEIAEQKPFDKHELQSINGMGSAKIERYGDELLVIINSPLP